MGKGTKKLPGDYFVADAPYNDRKFRKSEGGAEGGTRTRTGLPATPSRWCVYQIPPLRHRVVISEDFSTAEYAEFAEN